MKVLIVESDPHTQKLFQSILSREGHTVLFSPAGSAGLLSAKQYAPDLILLDVPLLDSDGMQFLQKLRAVPETETVPVLILIAKLQSDTMLKYMQAGASACLDKPFRIHQLLAQVEALRR